MNFAWITRLKLEKWKWCPISRNPDVFGMRISKEGVLWGTRSKVAHAYWNLFE